MKQLLLLLLVVLCFLTLFAHEFWLAPNRYRFALGDTAVIRFNVGENFKGENWNGDAKRIASLIHYDDTGHNDVSHLIKAEGDSLALRLTRLGTHMVTFESSGAFIKMHADSFNAYLKEDGLDNVLDYRKKNKEMQQPAREKYFRSVKTIFQVGNVYTDRCLEKTDLPLDIIPADNYADFHNISPYHVGRDRVYNDLTFKVYFRGEALKKAFVKCYRKKTDGTAEESHSRTNKKGEATFSVQLPGEFLISAVYMERNTADSSSQWKSYWGSLTFAQKGNFFIKRRIKQ